MPKPPAREPGPARAMDGPRTLDLSRLRVSRPTLGRNGAKMFRQPRGGSSANFFFSTKMNGVDWAAGARRSTRSCAAAARVAHGSELPAREVISELSNFAHLRWGGGDDLPAERRGADGLYRRRLRAGQCVGPVIGWRRSTAANNTPRVITVRHLNVPGLEVRERRLPAWRSMRSS